MIVLPVVTSSSNKYSALPSLDFKDLVIVLSDVDVTSFPKFLIFSASLKKYGGGWPVDSFTTFFATSLVPLLPSPENIPVFAAAIPAVPAPIVFKSNLLILSTLPTL